MPRLTRPSHPSAPNREFRAAARAAAPRTTFRLTLLSLALALVAIPVLASAQSDAEKLTFEPSGWLVLNSYGSRGNMNAVDLPRWAIAGEDERAFGMAVRQSRVRLNMGIPTDGIIGAAKLKGFVEIDFMGGNAGNGVDDSLPLPRLRHAYAAATWKTFGNVSLLVGQTWGIFGGPFFADSLSHLAIPRFGGAGFLFRRAPQVRVSGEIGKTMALGYTLGVLAPLDQNRANAASTLFVGARSATPHLEGRIATAYRPLAKRGLEVGLSAHVGREKYALNGVDGSPDRSVSSRGAALDAKLDLPYVTLKGAGFVGENLDVHYSWAPGVVQIPVSTTDTRLTGVSDVATRGYWGQAVVSPMKQFSLLLGTGMEQPRSSGLAQVRNRQISGGVIANLSSRWRTSLEYTSYVTRTVAGRFDSGQVEASALLAF
jgi:hypothetical protein